MKNTKRLLNVEYNLVKKAICIGIALEIIYMLGTVKLL